jgi:transposase
MMVMDGAGWHRASDLVGPENIEIIPLPLYSPELNPVEHIREEIHEKWFNNNVFKDLNAVDSGLGFL